MTGLPHDKKEVDQINHFRYGYIELKIGNLWLFYFIFMFKPRL